MFQVMKTRAHLHAMKWKVLTHITVMDSVRKTTKKAKVTVKLVIQKSEPICENSPVTQMDVAVALLRWSSKYSGVSEAAVSDLLSLLQSLMSLAVGQRIKFPNTFKKARALLSKYITETKQYQICSNGCMLYAEREEGDLVYDVQAADPVHPFKTSNSQYSMYPSVCKY
ncbi:unnamed protein product [Porites evermanni]|uniref:Uncharacterized protein n=1 Tax=Porites evermanni TaxID=104178 RepID=A0ABN8RJN2_9CNID|nr:unnamed protein product [Porites evermanni]